MLGLLSGCTGHEPARVGLLDFGFLRCYSPKRRSPSVGRVSLEEFVRSKAASCASLVENEVSRVCEVRCVRVIAATLPLKPLFLIDQQLQTWAVPRHRATELLSEK